MPVYYVIVSGEARLIHHFTGPRQELRSSHTGSPQEVICTARLCEGAVVAIEI
jgi:hypothetical protein